VMPQWHFSIFHLWLVRLGKPLQGTLRGR
jgi:hypothetical protein